MHIRDPLLNEWIGRGGELVDHFGLKRENGGFDVEEVVVERLLDLLEQLGIFQHHEVRIEDGRLFFAGLFFGVVSECFYILLREE